MLERWQVRMEGENDERREMRNPGERAGFFAEYLKWRSSH